MADLYQKTLGFSIFTQGDTMQELKNNIKDAISYHFYKESGIPKVIAFISSPPDS